MKQAIIVVDLGFGDAGKGTTIDALARKHNAKTVVRFNGGAQAYHCVVLPDGRWHGFSQFSSASFIPDVKTVLSKDVCVDPITMSSEALELAKLGLGHVWDRMFVARKAKIVTPFHIVANRIKETIRGNGRHGSCGMGIGETMADDISRPDLTIFAEDILYSDTRDLAKKLIRVQEHNRAKFQNIDLNSFENSMLTDFGMPHIIAHQLFGAWYDRVTLINDKNIDKFLEEDTVLFEGAQGVLLDEWYGFHPYTTWSTTTFENALNLLEKHNYNGKILKYGVTRTYHTRHGAGPFPSENTLDNMPEKHNSHGPYQGGWRVGSFDKLMFDYALRVCGDIDGLVVTHCDYLNGNKEWPMCYRYVQKCNGLSHYSIPVGEKGNLLFQEELTKYLDLIRPECAKIKPDKFLEFLSHVSQAPIVMKSFGPTYEDKEFVCGPQS